MEYQSVIKAFSSIIWLSSRAMINKRKKSKTPDPNQVKEAPFRQLNQRKGPSLKLKNKLLEET